MKVDIWFPFYVSDYISDTMALSVIEHGIYILLMIHCWKKGKAPKDAEKLKAITKTSTKEMPLVFAILNEYFEEHDTFYINKRLAAEKTKAEDRRARASENGKLGGRPKSGTTAKKKFDREWYEMVLFFENKCLCCGEKFPDDMMPSMDHIIPKCFGGMKEIKNIQPLCLKCNREKSNNHSTDYRLEFLEKIPEELRTKWFTVGKINKTIGLLEEKQNSTETATPSHSHSHSHSSSSSPSPSPSPEERKHKHGEYNHVRLTEKQFIKLEEDYGKLRLKAMIVNLDEAIEIHAYRYKNHNLTLRKWNPLDKEKTEVTKLTEADMTPEQKEIKKLKSYIDSEVFPEEENIKFREKIAKMEGTIEFT